MWGTCRSLKEAKRSPEGAWFNRSIAHAAPITPSSWSPAVPVFQKRSFLGLVKSALTRRKKQADRAQKNHNAAGHYDTVLLETLPYPRGERRMSSRSDYATHGGRQGGRPVSPGGAPTPAPVFFEAAITCAATGPTSVPDPTPPTMLCVWGQERRSGGQGEAGDRFEQGRGWEVIQG